MYTMRMEFERAYRKQVTDLMDHSRSGEALDIIHAVLGLNSEAGELANAYIRSIGYNEILDRENVLEELGDILFFVTFLADLYGEDLCDIMVRNSKKLQKRYPSGKWTFKAAKERADKASAETKESVAETNDESTGTWHFVISDPFPAFRKENTSGS